MTAPKLGPPSTNGDAQPRQKLSDVLYERVLGLILSEAYPVGARLPTETDLAARFDVSRPIVREALARLREDGVIVSRQGSGSYVLRQPADTTLHFAQVNSIADIQRYFEFRYELEGGTAALAAQNYEETTLEGLRNTLAGFGTATKDRGLEVNADFDFHMAVAQASRNRFFVSALASLRSHMAFGMNLTQNLSVLHETMRARVIQVEHHEIVEAIRTRNPDWAREAMQAHLANARHRIFEGTEAGVDKTT